jgi:hypothetical protein
MANIPFYVYVTFGLTLIATLYLFYKATKKSKGFIILLSVWLSVQSIIGILGFYTITNTMPPRFQLLLLPTLVFTIIQFSTKRGRTFIDSLDLKALTIIHIVRIPVEIVLYWLFIGKVVPELMNVISLGLLLNVVANGMLSAPTPFQQFGFEQPNIAVLHFPFMFLPACIVPIILFSHLSSIRQLVFNKSLINKI